MEIISVTIVLYLGLSSLYLFVFALASKLPKVKKVKTVVSNKINSVVVLIPAYKEDNVIVEVAKKALLQNYPDFSVVIIADSLKDSTLLTLAKLPVTVIEVFFEKSTKVKALNVAFKQLPDFDTALVLDADNIMDDGFLSAINLEFNKGYSVIQAQRTAKNLKSNFAILDGLSEAINNNIYNLGCIRLGLSSRLVGSGMFFNYQLLKNLIEEAKAIGGFDKELEIKLIKDNIYIHYVHDIILFDEKVNSGADFKKQRTRWLAAQFFFLKQYGSTAVMAFLRNGNSDFLNKIIQMALPPRLLIPVILLLGSTLHIFFETHLIFLWLFGLALNLIANLISIPASMYNKHLLFALFSIPKAALMIVLGLFDFKKANTTFIHTPHNSK
jgi:cellulose synthase/poly-beta-1,6-N-acetylglucosamine synthase-like glycosyltransferase